MFRVNQRHPLPEVESSRPPLPRASPLPRPPSPPLNPCRRPLAPLVTCVGSSAFAAEVAGGTGTLEVSSVVKFLGSTSSSDATYDSGSWPPLSKYFRTCTVSAQRPAWWNAHGTTACLVTFEIGAAADALLKHG